MSLPEPMTPSDCDLRDYAFMPLDVARFRDSDLAATLDAESFRAAIMLWCAAWHQVPAGSIPDNDTVLARLAGFGRFVDEWLKVKPAALTGFRLCSDGRLYHPVVCAKAREAWAKKQAYRARASAGGKAKAEKSQQKQPAPPFIVLEADDKQGLSVLEAVLKPAKGQGQGQGDNSLPTVEVPSEPVLGHSRKRERPKPKEPSKAFQEFWSAYPRKVGKLKAIEAYAKAQRGADPEAILEGLRAACASSKWRDEPEFIPHPATWLNQGRWMDEAEVKISTAMQKPVVVFGNGG